MNRRIIYSLAVLGIFALGFVAGMEYKAYQVRSAIDEAFSSEDTTRKNEQSVQQEKKENKVFIDKEIGDELVMTTGNLKVNETEERNTISSSYSTPVVAQEGTKFIVVNLDVVNTTDSDFLFDPNDVFRLVDNHERQFTTFDESIGSIDDYLNFQELSPGIKKTGNLVYQIPEDSSSYSLLTAKAGTNEVYKIKLK